MNYDTYPLELHKVLAILAKYGRTQKGKDALGSLAPCHVYETIQNRLEETDEALSLLFAFGEAPFGGITDIVKALDQARIGSVLSPYQLLDVSQCIYAVKNLIAYEKQVKNAKHHLESLQPYFSQFVDLSTLSKTIEKAIDDHGEVLDQASPALYDVRRALKATEARLRAKMQELLASKSSQLNESIIVMRNDRMCLPVKAEYKNAIKGIIHDESASRTTVYIEPSQAIEINNQLFSLMNKEKQEIEKILRALSAEVAIYYEELMQNLEAATSLDVIFSKARYAKETDSIKPLINQEGIIDLRQARHPLIAKEVCVPIDVTLGEPYKAIIITGPNTGGKTVSLKTVGLLTLMMQCGFFVPAKEGSKLAVFDNVFVDIGDEQSIEQSLSTFSSHMSKIVKIIDLLTLNSLVLLDELGSGTDPKEGASLAKSILNYLSERNARTIITSHYSELKAYAYDKEDILNASVEFNTETLSPTYRLLLGISGKSNALEISKRLGLNQTILDRAKENVITQDTDISVLMAKLESERLRVENERALLEEAAKAHEQAIKELKLTEKKLLSERDAFLNDAKKEAEKLIKKAKEEAQLLIDELDRMSKESVKSHELANMKFHARNLGVESQILPETKPLTVGQQVFVRQYQREGEIVSIQKGKYDVKMGMFQLTFDGHELEAIEPKEKKKPMVKRKLSASTVQVEKQAKLELDLRGYRFEDVYEAIDKFVDNAILTNMHTIRIVHGFGTGAVRKAVHDYLKASPYVKSYRFGVEGEGLNGATIAYLK